MPDMIQPDEKLGPSHIYFGIYKPSPTVFFYDDNSNDKMLANIVIDLIIIDSNYTSDQLVQEMFEMNVYDTGKFVKSTCNYICNFNLKYL